MFDLLKTAAFFYGALAFVCFLYLISAYSRG